MSWVTDTKFYGGNNVISWGVDKSGLDLLIWYMNSTY